MRNGNALTEAGGAESLARKQAVEDDAPANVLMVLEDQAGLLEDAFFAACVEIDQDVLGGKEGGDEVQGKVGRPAGEAGRCPTAVAGRIGMATIGTL